MSGKVYLVGAGPGAADLLTVRAARLLGEAGIVFHDALVAPAVLELAARAEKVAVGKRCGKHSSAQRFINKRLADAARTHEVVVRLKGGDPMLFGRAQEEIDFLRRRGVRVEVVPGVTAALAGAAELGISLTRRGVARSVAFVTPRAGEGEAPTHWIETALRADTVVIYMGRGEALGIAEALIGAGMPAGTPAVVLENASLEAQAAYGSLGDLPELARGLSSGPALIVLGEILREAASAAPLLRSPARRALAQ